VKQTQRGERSSALPSIPTPDDALTRKVDDSIGEIAPVPWLYDRDSDRGADYLSCLRVLKGRDDADCCLSVLLPVRGMRRVASAASW
jgi:hypothetical protein